MIYDAMQHNIKKPYPNNYYGMYTLKQQLKLLLSLRRFEIHWFHCQLPKNTQNKYKETIKNFKVIEIKQSEDDAQVIIKTK